MHFVFQFYLSDTDDLHTTSYDLKLSESMYFQLIAQPHVVYSFSRRGLISAEVNVDGCVGPSTLQKEPYYCSV